MINGEIAKEGGLEEADVATIKYMRPLVSSVPAVIIIITASKYCERQNEHAQHAILLNHFLSLFLFYVAYSAFLSPLTTPFFYLNAQNTTVSVFRSNYV